MYFISCQPAINWTVLEATVVRITSCASHADVAVVCFEVVVVVRSPTRNAEAEDEFARNPKNKKAGKSVYGFAQISKSMDMCGGHSTAISIVSPLHVVTSSPTGIWWIH